MGMTSPRDNVALSWGNSAGQIMDTTLDDDELPAFESVPCLNVPSPPGRCENPLSRCKVPSQSSQMLTLSGNQMHLEVLLEKAHATLLVSGWNNPRDPTNSRSLCLEQSIEELVREQR